MEIMFLLLLFFGIPLLLVLAARSSNSHAASQRADQARLKYQEALERLKSDPASSNRQTALELGRQYSNLSRQSGGVTLFDEMALMNDLDAATSAPVVERNLKPPVEVRLEKLSDLKTSGVIDEREYSERRKQILDDV